MLHCLQNQKSCTSAQKVCTRIFVATNIAYLLTKAHHQALVLGDSMLSQTCQCGGNRNGGLVVILAGALFYTTVVFSFFVVSKILYLKY
jgi:hypothetical protein